MILARASLRLQELPSTILARPPGERAFIFAMIDLERRAEEEIIKKR